MSKLNVFDKYASKDFKSDLEKIGKVDNVELVYERKVGSETWYDVLIFVMSSNPNIDFDIKSTLKSDFSSSIITDIWLHEADIANRKIADILVRRLSILKKYFC